MKRCLDVDRLVTLGSLFDWRPDRARHLAECDECLARLRELASLREALSAEIEPAAGFADRVVRSLPLAAHAQRPPRRRIWLSLLNPVLAGLTTLVAVGVASEPGAATGLGPSAPVASLVAGVVTGW